MHAEISKSMLNFIRELVEADNAAVPRPVRKIRRFFVTWKVGPMPGGAGVDSAERSYHNSGALATAAPKVFKTVPRERTQSLMGATLDALHRLQEVELQIAELRRVIDRKVRAVRQQESRIADLQARSQTDHDALRAGQMEADRLDLDVKSREAEIAKLRSALQGAKTNKEYSALLTQLNTIKADASKIEDRVLALMTELDKKRQDYAALQEQVKAEEAKLAELQRQVRDAEAKSRDRMEALRGQRDQAAAAVPPTALETFERMARKNDGEAMAKVMRTNPKRAEYACEGCNMSITIEQVNAILSRDEAITCNICGRILYLDAAPASSMR